MIQLKNLSLSFPHKTCFEDFSADIYDGNRIAIIGRNGCGKSSLLKMIKDIPTDISIGYVPQIIEDFDDLSGGQRFNKSLTKALSQNPNLLLLDEPTNHLDQSNRRSLIRMLDSYSGMLIIASHDLELLNKHIDILWHINDGSITKFTGNYDDYMRELQAKRSSISKELSKLERQKDSMHQALMKEQARASKSRKKGEKSISQRKWPTIVSHANARNAQETSGKKKSNIGHKKQMLNDQISNLYLNEIITPKFSLNSNDIGEHNLISISEASISYKDKSPILHNINLSINSKDRIAIIGNNATGKSSLIKAIMNNDEIIKWGSWHIPSLSSIGYLDQHYNTLDPNNSALETIQKLNPNWSHAEIRNHLNDFLFRKNEEVNTPASKLSGGENARLTLAQIAANTPKLLILDEITNNLDLETKEHVTQVLKNYPGAIIVISHDEIFLEEIIIHTRYRIHNGEIKLF